MKILFACNDGFIGKNGNPFARVLAECFMSLGHIIEYGSDTFWKMPLEYDLLFLQWPESLFEWQPITYKDCARLKSHMNMIFTSKTKVLVTCHNLKPHSNDKLYMEVYNYVYEYADAIHHMGQYSYDVLKQKYPNKLHFIAPHPVYYDLKAKMPSKGTCRRHFHLPMQRKVMLCFGAFRNDDERQMVYDIKNKFKDLIVLAPRFQYLPFYNGHRPAPRNIWKFFLYHIKGIKISRERLIKESEIKYYVGSADFLFIQRNEILNSGNLPLAFSAGLPVVGPAIGNVGQILKETGNFCFTPEDVESILFAINSILTCDMRMLGNSNYLYAMEKWSAKSVCSIIEEIIVKLTS